MKSYFLKTVPALILGVVALASCSVSSHTEKAVGVNFSKYKTFSWVNTSGKKADRANNDIVDNNIKNSVGEQLAKKGWVETDNNPDVLLDYTIAVQKGRVRETDPIYTVPYTRYVYGRRGIYTLWYPSMLMGYHSYNVPFTQGALTINMFDAKTNKLIWQGWAKGEINNRITSKDATADVKSIFRKFNYPNS